MIRIKLQIYNRSDTIFTKENIREDVQSIKEHYQTNDIYKLCKRLKLNIFSNELGNVKGILQFHKGKVIVHINTNMEYKGILLSYILGYFFFHAQTNQTIIFKEVACREALIFSSEFLNQPISIVTVKLNHSSGNPFFFTSKIEHKFYKE
ncbi:hypothetical protein [Oceanobacillus profundus]|uniref:hypothetical protein n=1 Tax=Oceanobacillus profundus TaxID=372463 RepID=UPI0026E326D2|nr:hypothetical protein [Oceanobacillus profundus]